MSTVSFCALRCLGKAAWVWEIALFPKAVVATMKFSFALTCIFACEFLNTLLPKETLMFRYRPRSLYVEKHFHFHILHHVAFGLLPIQPQISVISENHWFNGLVRHGVVWSGFGRPLSQSNRLSWWTVGVKYRDEPKHFDMPCSSLPISHRQCNIRITCDRYFMRQLSILTSHLQR